MRLSATKMGVTNQNRSLGNQLWDLAGGRPSLDLPFADNKSLVDATTGANLVDFTRASSGTYVGSDGLIKTAPVNLLTYSEQFDQWVIGGGSSVTANQAVAPDGTNTADRVQHTGSGLSWIRQDVLNVGTQYTATVYAKAVTPGTNDQFTFNIGGATNSDIKTATSEWQRFTWTATASANSFYINNGDDSFSTDVYFWGAQLEEGTTATTYIPTTSTLSGAPRFDHDPATGESLGLLIEEPRTNLLTYSEQFDQSGWVKNGSFVSSQVPNAALAPDGTQSAEEYQNSSTGSNNVEQRISVSAQPYVFSVYLKAKTASDVGKSVLIGGHLSGSTHLREAVQLPAEWTRFTKTGTTTSDKWNWGIDGRTSGTFAGINVTREQSSFYVWGAQLEADSFPTSYIPTSDSTVTRAADVAEITGANFSSWYNQTEGTVFVESRKLSSSALSHHFSLNKGSASYRIIHQPPSFALYVSDGGVEQARNSNTVYASGDFVKAAIGVAENGFAIVADGTVEGVDNSGTVPAVSQLNIGDNHLNTNQINGHIKRLSYFPTRLPDATLQSITS